MQRDDNLEIIKNCLDSIVLDESKSIQYEAILAIANNNMNLDIHVDKNNKHEILWFNKKKDTTFDNDLEKLVKFINEIYHE